jgi:hypothetical protein
MNEELTVIQNPNPAPKKRQHLRTLILDIGTQLGFAVLEGDVIVESGTLLLASEPELERQRKEGKERTLDIRFIRICDFIERKIADGVTRIVFEDVSFSTTTAQTQLWSSLRAAIWASAHKSAAEVFCLHALSLKAFATGNGAAEKIHMAKALAAADPERYEFDGSCLWLLGRTADDNEVDAIWLARFTIAVDQGREQFLSTYQRDCLRREKKRRKRLELKAARKARQLARKAQEKIRRQQLKDALKGAGRCCGVWRKLHAGHRAICPKCGVGVRLQIPTGFKAEQTLS